MNFDIRIPVGLMFTIFGLILTSAGIFGAPEMYEKSLGINMNLWWGAATTAFGLVMLALAYRGRKKP